MLAILIVLDCYRIGWVAWGLQRITDTQSTLQSKKSPYNPQNPVAIENRVIKDCGRILWLVQDHFSRLFSQILDFWESLLVLQFRKFYLGNIFDRLASQKY